MLIDDIDFADLYLQQLRLAHRTEKTPHHTEKTPHHYGHVEFMPVDKIANCRITAPGTLLSRTSAGVWARLTTMSVSGYIAGINNKMLVPSPLPAATGRSSGGIAYRRRHCDDWDSVPQETLR